MGTLARAVTRWTRRHSLRPYVFATGCCAPELAASLRRCLAAGRHGLRPQAPGPAGADLLIVAGRLTPSGAVLLRQTYRAMGEPRWVMAFGACAISGGPFDTYALAGGAATCLAPDVPVDVYVPGCPPLLSDLEAGLEVLRQRMGQAAAGRPAGS